MPENAVQTNPMWIVFALMTAVSWGLYGVFLHSGQMGMSDPVNGRYKAFLWVGIAYFLIAVLAPVAVLVVNQSGWSMPMKGVMWSLLAGMVGAIGAFCVLLAFGAAKSATYVVVIMSIIFAGAPIVNAVATMVKHPESMRWANIPWQFFLGILLAALGGMLVTLYKPPTGRPAGPTPPTDVVQHVIQK